MGSKKIILTALSTMMLSCGYKIGKKEKMNKETTWEWNLEKSSEQAEDFNNPLKWNLKTFKMETQNVNNQTMWDLPMFGSPFPTPHYSSPGNGCGPIKTEIGGKLIIGHNVIIGRAAHSEYLFENLEDDYVTYFTILTISDNRGAYDPVESSSRNHPHYISQGSLNTSSKSRVDWIALQLADKNAYAIANERLFDLRVGRVILSAPQQDGSILFYQMNAPIMNSDQRKDFIDHLNKDNKVIEFFTSKGNI